jgi:NAD(P)-dependent dehydrogenase (short-subunit alcohol dehydrogenase family)
LLPVLLAAPAPRVVTTSSVAHRTGKIRWDDLQWEQGRYQRWSAYGQSKLANLMFALELGRRTGAAGLSLRSLAAHPGYAATNLQLAGPRMQGSKLNEKVMTLANGIAQSDEKGALPTLYAATVPGLPSGSYVGPDGPLEMCGYPRLVGTSGRARDQETAQRLWEVSEDLTGVHYDFGAVAAAG